MTTKKTEEGSKTDCIYISSNVTKPPTIHPDPSTRPDASDKSHHLLNR